MTRWINSVGLDSLAAGTTARPRAVGAERWSQRIYKDDEVSHLPNLGNHNPHIKKTKKLSPRERKMKKQQMLRALEDEVGTVVGQTIPASDYSDMQCAGDAVLFWHKSLPGSHTVQRVPALVLQDRLLRCVQPWPRPWLAVDVQRLRRVPRIDTPRRRVCVCVCDEMCAV